MYINQKEREELSSAAFTWNPQEGYIQGEQQQLLSISNKHVALSGLVESHITVSARCTRKSFFFYPVL